jgi:hypothetical protein
MKNSIEYLINEVSAILTDTHLNSMQYLLLADALKKAREKHKEEIMKAFLDGKVNHNKDWAKEYYNQTYNQNK